MGRKAKFRPTITRVKLNPEQAVLASNCYNVGHQTDSVTTGTRDLAEGYYCYLNKLSAWPKQRGACEGVLVQRAVSSNIASS